MLIMLFVVDSKLIDLSMERLLDLRMVPSIIGGDEEKKEV